MAEPVFDDNYQAWIGVVGSFQVEYAVSATDEDLQAEIDWQR